MVNFLSESSPKVDSVKPYLRNLTCRNDQKSVLRIRRTFYTLKVLTASEVHAPFLGPTTWNLEFNDFAAAKGHRCSTLGGIRWQYERPLW